MFSTCIHKIQSVADVRVTASALVVEIKPSDEIQAVGFPSVCLFHDGSDPLVLLRQLHDLTGRLLNPTTVDTVAINGEGW